MAINEMSMYVLYIYSLVISWTLYFIFFFFNDTAPTAIYTLSLHDALPISPYLPSFRSCGCPVLTYLWLGRDRKSTRLNSSHVAISYAVCCLNKKRSA